MINHQYGYGWLIVLHCAVVNADALASSARRASVGWRPYGQAGEPDMSKDTDLISELQQKRDEIKLRIHLGTKELKDDWNGVEAKWEAFAARAQLEKAGKDVGEALEILGAEVRDSFQRIWAALK
jgi:hypothetical protein